MAPYTPTRSTTGRLASSPARVPSDRTRVASDPARFPPGPARVGSDPARFPSDPAEFPPGPARFPSHPARFASGPAPFVSDPGSATVELAAAIPLLVAVTLAMVGLLGLARDQVLAQGAAREAAREAAVGGDPDRASAAARAALPPGRVVRVAVVPDGADRVRATVELPVGLPFGVPPVVIRATSVAASESGPPPTPVSS